MKRALLVGSLLVACGGQSAQRAGTRFPEMLAVRESPAVSRTKGSKTFAFAEEAREQAERAEAEGDLLAAKLLAERAVARYTRAVAEAETSRTKLAREEADRKLSAGSEEYTRFFRVHGELATEIHNLERELAIARERLLPARSGATSGARELARIAAGRALLAEASLLCAASDLVRVAKKEPKGTTEARAKIVEAAALLPKGAPAGGPFVDSAREARVLCLRALTEARVDTPLVGVVSDELLAELSGQGPWSVFRDERGVVIALDKKPGQDLVDRLARIAQTHPKFAVLVVAFFAQVRGDERAKKEATSLAEAMMRAGAPHAAGESAPLSSVHEKTEGRVEVVFVPLSR